jgi:hypothetical protein
LFAFPSLERDGKELLHSIFIAVGFKPTGRRMMKGLALAKFRRLHYHGRQGFPGSNEVKIKTFNNY